MKNTIRKSPYNIENVYASLDPSEDFEKLISRNKIDLVFLLARFYGINTLKYVKKLHKNQPNVKVVYYGEISENAYIRQFTEINGIYNYALPHREQNVLKAIETYNAYVESQNETENFNKKIYQKTINNKDLFIDKFLNGIIKGAIKNSGEILTSFKHFNIDLDSGYRVLIFRIDHYKKIILTMEESEKHVLISKMKYHIDSKIGKTKHVSFFPQLNELVVITNGYEDLTKTINIAEAIKEDVLVSLDINITVGIGRHYESIKNLYVSYNEAVTAYNYRFHIGYRSVIPIEYVEPYNTVTHKITNEKKDKLIYTTVMGETDYAKQQVEKIFRDLKDIKKLPQKYPSKFVHSIIVDVDTYSEAKGISIDSFYKENIDYNYIHNIKELDDAEKYLIDFIQKFCNHINKLREDEAVEIYHNAKKFFDEYYYESFSINKVAIGLSVSADYLNSLFKRYSSETAYDYVQRKRLEKAKKFLREDDCDDAYIAAQVGFDSKTHFRNIFKLYEKRTTEDYRSQYNVFTTTLNKNSFKLH